MEVSGKTVTDIVVQKNVMSTMMSLKMAANRYIVNVMPAMMQLQGSNYSLYLAQHYNFMMPFLFFLLCIFIHYKQVN